MRTRLGPVGPLVVSLCVIGAVTACSSPESGDPATTTATSLASSDLPAGSSGSGASGSAGSGSGSSGAGSGSAGSGSGGAGQEVPVGAEDPQPARGGVEVLRTIPHDPSLFTQGLEIAGDQIYESTGQYGSSEVQRRPIASDQASLRMPMADDEFGEGLTLTPDTLWTLTWTNGVAHNRDPETLEVRETVEYEGEGWGLCHDGDRLVMSDGSDQLTFRDPVTFEPTGTVSVTAGGAPVERVNELECVGDDVLANVWMTDEIVRIDPSSGAVTAIYDASELEQPRPGDPDAVLNGIAAVPDSDTVLLTGKLWDELYEVRLVE